MNKDDLPPLPYTTGYVTKKLINKLSCGECKLLFGKKHESLDLEIDEEHLKYLQCLDRGGLMYPSNMLFMVIQCSYSIFNMCVSSGM